MTSGSSSSARRASRPPAAETDRVNTLHHLVYASALASAVSRSRRERRFLMLAAIAPDLDGLTFWDRDLWEAVHHTFGHNVFFAGGAAAAALALARPGRRARLAAWTAVATLGLHYGLDLAISGTWPFRPLWPVSGFDANLGNFVADPIRLDWWLRVPVQWTLVAGAIALLVRTWRRHGRSGLELVSDQLDDLVAGYLARILAGKRCADCGDRAGFRCAACHGPICGAHARLRGLEATCASCEDAITAAPS